MLLQRVAVGKGGVHEAPGRPHPYAAHHSLRSLVGNSREGIDPVRQSSATCILQADRGCLDGIAALPVSV